MTRQLRFAASYKVGDDFKAIIQDLTITYLIEQPPNLIEFGLKYFGNLKNRVVVVKDLRPQSDEEGEAVEPELSKRLSRSRRMSVYAEPYNPEEDEDLEVQEIFPKTDSQKKSLMEQARKVMLFRALDEEQFSEIVDAMFEKMVVSGEKIIQQGDDGDFFYIIDSGIFEASTKDKFGNSVVVKAYTNSGSFGELALLYNVPRSATVTAKSNGRLWVMKRETFRRIVVSNAFKKRKLYELLIDQVPMLSVLEPYEKLNVADALIPKSYKDGERVLQQGDTAEGMYFVESGEVEISVLNDSGEEVVLKSLKQGEYFGELALVTHQPRAASAYAKGNVKLAYLDVEAFERLLGPCMEIMRRNMAVYDEQMKYIRGAPRIDQGIKI